MHLLRQGAVIRSLLGTLMGNLGTSGGVQREMISPRDSSLVQDYVREVGGEARSYTKTLPPHLFPQWLFPLQSRCLARVALPTPAGSQRRRLFYA